MTTNTEDTTRLPQWAQRRINKLEQDIRYYKQQIEELSGDKPSDLQWSMTYTSWHNIPTGSIVRLRLSDGQYIEINKNSHGQVRLSANKILVIKPGAANSVFVESEDY